MTILPKELHSGRAELLDRSKLPNDNSTTLTKVRPRRDTCSVPKVYDKTIEPNISEQIDTDEARGME